MSTLARLIPRQHLLLDDLDPNDVYVNSDVYDNDNIEVRYAQALDPWRWTRGWVHALGMVYFIMGMILIFTFLYFQDRRIDRARLKTALANVDNYMTMDEYAHRSFLDRLSTHLRSFTYKRTRSRWWWNGMGNMSLGLFLIVLAGWAYPLLYVFTQRPYYQIFSDYGPPGLAGRSGMIGIALTPFILALGMKANLISFMTGVGHERLNALHRWMGMLAGIMGVIHTIPFLVEPVRDEGWHALKNKLLHGRGNIYYWNGFGALACLLWLCIASFPFIRRRFYETFKYLHIVAGVGYVGLMFWHCSNMLTSWHYLYATVGIWTTGLAYRIFVKTNWFSTQGKWFAGDRATFTKLSDDGIKITIPTKMKWKPGQHVLLRIPEISWLDNHPFTIASVMREDEDVDVVDANTAANAKNQQWPTSNSKTHTGNDKRLERVRQSHKFGESGKDDEYNDLVVVFKPYKGFTRKAWEISRTKPDTTFRALLDGPYGGMPRKLESFDTVLMIAGGSGITPLVAHLQDLCRKIKKGQAVTVDIRIVWTVKRFESLEWFKNEISAATRSVPFGMVHCQYFVTEESPVEFSDYPVSATKQWPSSSFPNTPGAEDPYGGTIPPMPAAPGTAMTTPHHFPAPYPQYPEIPKFSQYPLPQPQYPQYPQYPQPIHSHTSMPAQMHSPTDTVGSIDKKELIPNKTETNYNVREQETFPTAEEEKRLSDLQVQGVGQAITTDDVHLKPNRNSNQRNSLLGSKDGIKLYIPERAGAERDGILRCPTPVPDFGDEVMIEFGRPRLREGIRPWAEEFGRRTCVYVCGPESMKIDVSNAVASLQHDIWHNHDREEVYLHTETFGW